jgi:putative addiction module killer protein
MEWYFTLPIRKQAIITARFDRIELDGHLGWVNRFEGLIELKWTSGLRIYTFLYENKVMIAVHGGNKNGQEKDIRKAKKIRTAVLDGSYSK